MKKYYSYQRKKKSAEKKLSAVDPKNKPIPPEVVPVLNNSVTNPDLSTISISGNWASSRLFFNLIYFSIGFALINHFIAPYFWKGFEHASSAGYTNYFLGIAGLMAWLIDPFAWYYHAQLTEKKTDSNNSSTSGSAISLLFKYIIEIIFTLVLLVPGTIAWIIRPVIRALILMISLNFISPSVGYNHPILALLVLLDIALFYINSASPGWKYNPMKYIFTFFYNARFRFNGVIATIAYMIQTSLYFSIFQFTANYSIQKEPHTSLWKLSFFWLLAVVFSQFPYLVNAGYENINLDNTSKAGKWLLLLSFMLSYCSFMYPYFRL